MSNLVRGDFKLFQIYSLEKRISKVSYNTPLYGWNIVDKA